MENTGTYRNFIERIINSHLDEPVFLFWNEDKSELIKIYGDKFKKDVNNLSSYLINNGFGNKRICILADNSYNYLLMYFSIICSNGVAVLLDNNLTIDEYNEVLKFNDCDLLYYSSNMKNIVDELCVKSYDLNETINSISENNNALKIDLDPDKVCTVIFTSGTTGIRKGVELTQNNFLKNIDGAWDMRTKDIEANHLPLYHVYSLYCSLYALYHGLTLFIGNNVRFIMKDIVEVDASEIICVPSLLPYVYKALENNNRDRLIICGGAAGGNIWVDKFKQINVRLYCGYGMSETTGPVCVNDEYGNTHMFAGSVIEISEPNDEGVGEILIKGPSIMKDYYKVDENNLKDGYLYTGDLGKYENGNLYIVGRKKNILVLSDGENIAPEYIENKIMNIEGIKEVIVSLNEKGQLKAEIYAPSMDFNSVNTAIQALNKALNPHMRIIEINLKDVEFKKGSTGKIIRG